MMTNNSNHNNEWDFIDENVREVAQDIRPGLTYWKDVWRRFKHNKLAMLGLVMITIITLFAIFGPMFSPYSYSDQVLELSNVPPSMVIHELFDGRYVYVHKEFKLIEVTADGKIIGVPDQKKDDKINRVRIYEMDGKEVKLDYKGAVKKSKKGQVIDPTLPVYSILIDGAPINISNPKTVWNKTYPLGSDKLGRDMWVRVLFGARISLTVGVIAAIVNTLFGTLYGGIAGYEGGRIDNLMMRIVDIINSIPLMLIVILFMVIFNNSGLSTIIITIGLVYWVGMARQVRGQVLSLKEQEFVLAAKTLGATKGRIILRHLIPNALGPIVVSMMMSIPSAIFTESFLSFVGLGVSAPQASWGTLASDALQNIRSFPYQLIAPSVAIALTMFAFNFVGDGLRDALDPKQRR